MNMEKNHSYWIVLDTFQSSNLQIIPWSFIWTTEIARDMGMCVRVDFFSHLRLIPGLASKSYYLNKTDERQHQKKNFDRFEVWRVLVSVENCLASDVENP